MDAPEILTNKDYDFNVWENTTDPNFIDICAKSRLPEKWVRFDRVSSGKYSDSILKPINKYVENLYPAPSLVSIDDQFITLRQHNHAEIFILINDDGYKILDRPWMRQFYKSRHANIKRNECFLGEYVFYTPWVIDANVKVMFVPPEEESPFEVYEVQDWFSRIPSNQLFVEPKMIPARFRSTGSHIISPGFAKIQRGCPIFDMKIPASDIIVERIKEFYAKY